MFILFLFLFFSCGMARADVYVVTAPDSSIYSVSELDDAVVPNGYSKSVIKGTITNIPVSGDIKMYDFKKGTFTLNQKKVTDKNAADQAAILAAQHEADVRASARKKALNIGFTDEELDTVFGK